MQYFSETFKMRTVILVSILLVVACASPLQEQKTQFEAFKVEHNKSYKNQAEQIARFAVFQHRLREIEEHNPLYEQGLVTYKKGINQFSDWTDEERENFLLSHQVSGITSQKKTVLRSTADLPESLDLRQEGLVTEVKNQGILGACWVFALTGALEGAYAKKTGDLVSLSELQLTECVGNPEESCGSEYLQRALDYIKEYGLESEEDYPTAGADEICAYDASKVVTHLDDYSFFDHDEEGIAENLYLRGPVAAVIDATYLYDYVSGIFQNEECSASNLNHAVLVVGYGSEDGVDYWIVKNSWGPQYGEDGYVRLERGVNRCGIAEDDFSAIIN